MTTSDGTKTCDHEGCKCRVADTQSHIREDGKIFCSKACSEGRGCNCDDCDCGGGNN